MMMNLKHIKSFNEHRENINIYDGVKKSCGFIIKNIDGEVLITHPTNDYSGEGIWVFPKGNIEEGETELECALREVWEETNLKLSEIKGKITKVYEKNGNYRINVLFLFESEEDLKKYDIKCNSFVEFEDFEEMESFPENDDFKWVSFEKSLDYLSIREQSVIQNIFL
jgi:8-oxo-dGTP pyrophosphatase MutT (NUDIX family)